ncbi:MAG TPA: hypothetical protein VFR84_19070 [Candidatus Angelobacter sp.]|nr:hypothetical protein [Candidatus Angelobacter sp.]
MKALGASHGQVVVLFIAEAALAAALPVKTSWFYVVLAEVIAVAAGLLAGVLPARVAARLDPVQALRTESLTPNPLISKDFH